MTTTVGIRDISRNVNLLQEYDYVDIEDKKTHEYKGLFVSPKYADEFKKYLEVKLNEEKNTKLERLKRYAGKGEIDAKYAGLTSSSIREKIALDKQSE